MDSGTAGNFLAGKSFAVTFLFLTTFFSLPAALAPAAFAALVAALTPALAAGFAGLFAGL